MHSLYSLVFAIDIAALAAVVLFPILSIASLGKVGWRRGRITVAYLGYLCCAALVGSFVATFALEGGEIFMMFVFWLIPFTLAAGVALVLTVKTGSSDTLWKLALATILLGPVQVVAELLPGGIGGLNAVLLLGVYCIYPVFVTGMSIYHRDEWWLWSSDPAA
jgi:hypothetical protein